MKTHLRVFVVAIACVCLSSGARAKEKLTEPAGPLANSLTKIPESEYVGKKAVVDQLVVKKPYGAGLDILDERRWLLMPGEFNRSFHSCSGSGSIIANVAERQRGPCVY